jgi:hypothetical protein
MTGTLRALALLVMAGTLAGCTAWPVFSPPAAEHLERQKNQQEMADLLGRFHTLAGLSREKLARAYDEALLRLEARPDPETGLEAAFLHALLGSPRKGAGEVRAFMKQFEKADLSGGQEGYRGIAVLINRIGSLQQENERLRSEAGEEKERSEKLAHQLKELKNIEKIIYEREQHRFSDE